MTVTEGRSPSPSILDDYRERIARRREGIDETVTLDGIREPATELADRIAGLGLAGLRARRDETARFVADDGITYGPESPGADMADASTTPFADGVRARPWQLDPLPIVIDGAQWLALERGLRQRAVLLDAILTDLTGPQQLIRSGVVPGAAVFGHAGWLPQASGITLPGPRQLVLPATDLARDGEGTWRVIADRAEAPSGAGYAMANRRIVARVLPQLYRESPLARLRGFFDTVTRALHRVAPPGEDTPHAVILSAGALSETAFDEAFQSALLGLPLVTSEDLTSRDGRIWLRTTGGLTPVDVIVRRVDASWCDQLELRPESRLGLPGLVESARLGRISIVNPLTSGVIENPALIPYLPSVCRHLLGEDLLLRSPHTWWAGDPTHRSHILTHLAGLVIKPIARERASDLGGARGPCFGWELTSDEREDLAARISAEPWLWCAQDPLAMSSAPVVTDDGLDPRNVVLRTFAVADGDDYAVLPGGLARVSPTTDAPEISSLAGAPSKDVWVLGTPAPSATGGHDEGSALPLPPMGGTSPASAPAPRVASDLYWLGRYAERAEAAARLLRVADNLAADHAARPRTPGHSAMVAVLTAVTEVTRVRPGFTGEGGEARLADPLAHLRELVLDPRLAGSVACSARRATAAAQAVREQISADIWLVLSRLERTLTEAGPDDDLQELLMQALEALLALAGIGTESTVRDPAWAFTDAGRRMERAQQGVRLIRTLLAEPHSALVEATTHEAALGAAESIITYRRRLAAGLGPIVPAQAAVDLLLRDATNPRSVASAIAHLADALTVIADDGDPLIAEARALADRARGADLEVLVVPDRAPLAAELDDLDRRLRDLHSRVAARYFAGKGASRTVTAIDWTDGVA